MKSIVKLSGFAIAIALLFIACDSYPSLQKYYVDSKEDSSFISIDIPSSIIELKETEVSEDVQSTLETIKKINFLAFQVKEGNDEMYSAEKKKIQEILKNPKYKQLARFNRGGINVSVNYLGENDAIDEVIIFGADSEKGFAVIRVLGDGMNPGAIIKLTQDIQLDDASGQMEQLGSLLSSIK